MSYVIKTTESGYNPRIAGLVGNVTPEAIAAKEAAEAAASMVQKAFLYHASRFIRKLENREDATIVWVGDSITQQIDTHTGGQPNIVGLIDIWLKSKYNTGKCYHYQQRRCKAKY